MIRRYPCAQKSLNVVIFLLLMISSAGVVAAQPASPTPTPKSEEVLRLEEEKAQAELRKAIAEANKAELEAKFPKPTSTPLAGTTTIDDKALIEGQIVAYIALARAANNIVDAINRRQLSVHKLAIFNEDDIKLLLGYKVSLSQLKVVRDGYCSLLSPTVTGVNCPKEAAGITAFVEPLAIAKSLLGSFVDLTSLFRTNVEIKGQTFDIEDAPLAAEVFRAARRTDGKGFSPNVELYYPKVFSPDLNLQKQYEILGLIDKVQNLRNIAGRLIADLEKNAEDIGKAEAKVKNLELTIEQIEAAIADKKGKLSNLLQAHCRRLPANGREDVTALEARLRRYCPRLPAEQRERVFELADEIKKVDAELFKTTGALPKAQAALAGLKTDRAKLLGALQTAAVPPPNAIEVADVAAQLKARNEQFDKFVAAIVQVSAGGGPNALTSYIKAENLMDVLKENPSAAPSATPNTASNTTPNGTPNATPNQKSYWLQLKVVKAGGNNRIKTNLIWDVFTGGNRVSHSGGVIVEYILYDLTGKAIVSDTITEYTEYIKADKVRKLPSPVVDDRR